MFSEDDNTKEETEVIQLLMAQDLAKIASNRRNGVLFVAASSKPSEQFVSKCDIAVRPLLGTWTEGDARKALLKAVCRG